MQPFDLLGKTRPFFRLGFSRGDKLGDDCIQSLRLFGKPRPLLCLGFPNGDQVLLPRFLGCFRVHDQQKTMKWIDVGERESKILRERHVGEALKRIAIHRAIKGYMRRHVLLHRLYKLSMVQY